MSVTRCWFFPPQDSSESTSHGTLIICPASLIHHWKMRWEMMWAVTDCWLKPQYGPNRNQHAKVYAEMLPSVWGIGVLYWRVMLTLKPSGISFNQGSWYLWRPRALSSPNSLQPVLRMHLERDWCSGAISHRQAVSVLAWGAWIVS